MEHALNLETPLTVDELAALLEGANAAYRRGAPEMSDAEYDVLMLELAQRDPEHRLLIRVEPESDFGAGKVRHQGKPMLSTEKAYTQAELFRWIDRVERAAQEMGLKDMPTVRITAKLDGMAARYENGRLASRGDGLTGNDISRMIERGAVLSTDADGDGELVLDQGYFDQHLSEAFEFPRNVVAGIASADTVKPLALKALADGAIHFVRFADLNCIRYRIDELRETAFETLGQHLLDGCPFPTDGIVLSVEEPALREHMGSTSHHHRWMLAVKRLGETAETTVRNIRWQIGRTGRLTPVIEIEPVTLSGATISNVTGHHAGMVRKKGIGPGARITVIRSGEVIPKVTDVPVPVHHVELPGACPCCSTALRRQNDFLVCPNLECADRIQARLEHFFNIIGTIDLFGPVACERLVAYGVTGLADIFGLSTDDYEAMGFGPGQAANLVSEIDAARTRPVDDFRVLASLGIEHLGRGDAKKLLRVIPLSDVAKASAEDIQAIEGFGQHTAHSIAGDLKDHAVDLVFLRTHFERIIPTRNHDKAADSPLSGKRIVFTGKMEQGSRDEMIAHAERLGAVCQSSVNSKTDVLVAGVKTGESKLDKAQKHGITVLSERDYLDWISPDR